MGIVIAESEESAQRHFESLRAEQIALGKRIAAAPREDKHLFVEEAQELSERVKIARAALQSTGVGA